MNRSTRYPKELRERAVQLVFEHEREYSSQWAAISSIATKFGMTPETLRKWVPERQSLASPGRGRRGTPFSRSGHGQRSEPRRCVRPCHSDRLDCIVDTW